jgi:hypothetical protein
MSVLENGDASGVAPWEVEKIFNRWEEVVEEEDGEVWEVFHGVK